MSPEMKQERKKKKKSCKSLPGEAFKFQIGFVKPTWVKVGIPFLDVISLCSHRLVSPSSCSVFGHRSTQVATDICLISIHMNPLGTAFAAFAMLGIRGTIQLLVTLVNSLRLWKDPIGSDSTSGHFREYCCFLEFSLVNLLQKRWSQ